MSRKSCVPVASIRALAGETVDTSAANTQQNWKNIVFLPFNSYWEIFVVCTISANFLLVSFKLAFNQPGSHSLIVPFYFFEIVFLINTIAIISHRNMAVHRKTRYYAKASTFVILFSVVSLMPFYEVWQLLNSFKWDSHQSEKDSSVRLLNIKCALRIIYGMLYFKRKKQEVGLVHLHYVIFNHSFYYLIITNIFTVTWEMLRYQTGPNWTDNLHLHVYNKTIPYDGMMVTLHIVLGLFTHNWIGVINGVTVLEKIIVILILLTGFVFHMMFFYGELTAGFLQIYRHQFEFTTRLKKIMYLLDDWKVNKSVKKRTVDYYKLYWEKRSGINTMPNAFYLLPVSLRKEAMVDIFWEALRHSSFFCSTDVSFKRSLSLFMTNEFYLPGDFIFKAGEPKNKMFYVVTGKIQLLTEEDHESPILSLSGGTLLGEIASLCLHVSKINIRCDTYCEVQSLDIISLYRVLLEFRTVTTYLHELYRERIKYARWATSDQVPKYDFKIEGSEKATTIMKLKSQWKAISFYNAHNKIHEIDWSKIDRSFSSNYLGTLVITDSVELKENVICIQSECPFIMDPDSSFRRFLDYLVIASVVAQVILLPYPIFFLKNVSSTILRLMVVLDILYWLDIYIQLSTAVKLSNTKTLARPKGIIQYKFKQSSFILDIVSALPVYYLLLLMRLDTKLALLANIIRLIKVGKIFKLIKEKEKDLWIDNIYIRCVKYLVLSIICVYWGACVLYATSCFDSPCKADNWYAYNKAKRNLTDSHPFTKVLFFSVSLLLNINLSDHVFFSIADIYMCVALFIISYILTSFTFAELTASAALLFKETYQHQDEIVMFKIIMKRRFVHGELKLRLLKILEFNWLFNEGAEIQGKNGILSEASREIRTDIINERFISCFKLVPLLKDLPENLLKKLSLQAEVIILPPDTYVQNVNVMSHSIYIILRGYCEMKSMLPGDAERDAKIILKRGDMLAALETLHRIKIFGSIVSITAIELLSISYEAFVDIFQSYRSEYMFLQNALRQHMTYYESILMRKGCRLPEMKSPQQALGKVDTFRYEISVLRKKTKRIHKALYAQAFKSLGPWAFFRFFLLKTTINSKGTFYITWEIIRCICILIEVAICIVYISIPSSYNLRYVLYTFRFVGFTDIYIRFHCQYYNNRGIIVDHPLYTARNYVRSSFAIDLIGNIPMNWLWGANMFGTGGGRRVSAIIRLITRPLQLYRVFHGLAYMQSKLHWSSASVILKTKTTILVFVILGFLANLLLIATCTFNHDFTNCTNAHYIDESVFSESYRTIVVFMEALYFNVETFTHSVSGVFGVENDSEIIYFLFIECILYCLRCLILAVYTSSGIGGNVNLSTHQARMKQFLLFAKDLLLEESLTRNMVEHYEHVWKETLGTSINVISSKFNLYLRIQFVCFLYESSLRNTKLFAFAPASIIQRLSPCLKEVHFKRGGVIIRCNDVQNNLYFVHKGRVDITVANTVLTTLPIGGLFGCFHKSGIFRQTFTAVGKTHTILLALNSMKLQEIITEWDDKQSEDVLKQIRTLNVEYMEPYDSYSSMSKVIVEDQMETRYDKIISKINRFINVESFWFWLYDYILNVHIASIASILILAFSSVYFDKDASNTLVVLFYLVDVIFYIKIFLGFHVAYVDTTTGLLELKAKKIALRYLKTNFALDLFSCLPIELVVLYFTTKYVKIATFNRVSRFWFMYKYYTACKQKLILSKHLRWSYLAYWTMFRLQLMASAWFLVSCLDHNCYYVKERFGRPKTTFATHNDIDSALVGYTYTVNIFTTCGMRDTVPINWKELLVSTVMALFAQFMIANMASGFANMVIIEKNTMANYQHKINKMKIYLSGRHLSPALLHKVWEYYILLWRIQQGECLPRLITEAPSYLKQDVMLYLFGYHLENHFLFAKTHKDFLRQLVTLFERRVYLPGNVIVEKGDMDSAMYFVHKGEVGAFVRVGTNEVTSYILGSDMSFGEAQGLYNFPYRKTYKAISVTFILALRRSAWEYLLKWFPASQETIMTEATRHHLKERYSSYLSGTTSMI